MTTTVTVEAHCDEKTEVVVDHSNRLVVIQDGQKYSVHVYDDQKVVVFERPKE